MVESSSFFNMAATKTVDLIVRQLSDSGTTTSSASASSSATCGANDSSPRCELPAKSNSGIAIGLGIAVPCTIALIMFIVLGLRHRKVVQREDEESRKIDADNDDGFSEIPLKRSNMTLNANNHNDPNDPKTPYEKQHFDIPPGSLPSLPSKASMTTLTENPFSTPGSPYHIPELSSSQVSLNNYDPYDRTRYPPSGDIYRSQSPSYPPSVHHHQSQNQHYDTNPYGNLNSDKYNSSKQALNNPSSLSLNTSRDMYQNSNYNDERQQQRDFDDDHDNQSIPAPPFRRRASYEGSSTLSVVSSHTPTTAIAPQFPAPETANVHGETDEVPPSPPTPPPVAAPRKAVQFNQSDIDKDEQASNDPSSESKSKLGRSDTKNFDRVKSVYKEYFPTHMQSPERKPQEVFDFVPEERLDQNGQQGQYYEQDPHQQQYYEQDPHQQQQQYYDQDSQQQNPSGRPNLPMIDTSLQMPLGTVLPSTPRTVDSRASNQSTGHVIHSHVNKIELTTLPVPHNLSDNVSSIEYSKVRRNYEAGSPSSRSASPAPGSASVNASMSSTVIPVYNPLDNNLMYPGNDSNSSNMALPTPAQMRQSVAYMTNLEFQRPKKYNIDYSDSLSSSRPSSPALGGPDGSRPGTPAGARAMIGIAPRVRPPSELVPDSKTQFEKLRPTMEMR